MNINQHLAKPLSMHSGFRGMRRTGWTRWFAVSCSGYCPKDEAQSLREPKLVPAARAMQPLADRVAEERAGG